MNSINPNTVSAIIVTFNRLTFLQEILSAVKNQSRKPDNIIVVNNSSSDGTSEWLREQEGIILIEQENSGSSGGQFAGFKKAYETGCEWIWTMDDDVVPDENCLENLLSIPDKQLIRTPVRFKPDGNIFINDCLKFNLSNPFKSFWTEIISEKHFSSKLIHADGLTFEGPLFHRSVLEKIGFPEYGFFIYGDDSEYFIRAKKADFHSAIVSSAKMFRKLDAADPFENWSWKQYYIMRNLYAIDVLHGNIVVRLIRPVSYFIKYLLKCRNSDQIKTAFQAFKDGYFYKSTNNTIH